MRLSGFFISSQGDFDVLDTSTTLATTGSDYSLGRAFLRGGAGGPTTLLFRRDGNSQENFSPASAAFSVASTSAVPEPSAYVLVVGFAGLVFVFGWKKRAA